MMKAEKSYRDKLPRTIQQQHSGEGTLEFADNRQGGILSAALPLQRGEEDEPVQGKAIQAMKEVNARYARMQQKHGGGKPHGKRTSVPKSRIIRDEEKSKQEIADRLRQDDKYKEMDSIQLKPENRTGLPDNLKAGIEALSGFAMDDVRVHYNSDRPAAVQALAYAQGTDIHVAPGQERHLPHEAWHVAQQKAGRVEPTAEAGGLPVNDSAELEHEADMMGAKAMQLKSTVQFALSKNFRITILGGFSTDEAERAAAFIRHLSGVRSMEDQNGAVILVISTSQGIGVEEIRTALDKHLEDAIITVERGKTTFFDR